MASFLQLAGPVLAAAVAVTLFVLSGRRDRAKSKREAASRFRAAFSEAITQIDNKDSHLLMHEALTQHDVAIHEFRRVVRPDQLVNFDAAADKFRLIRGQLTPAILAYWNTISANKPIDTSDTIALKAALNELLTFADKT